MSTARRPFVPILLTLLLVTWLSPPTAHAGDAPDEVRVATYNVENWRYHFEGFRRGGPQAWRTDDADLRREASRNDRDNWIIANVVKNLDADVLLIQEGPEQAELDYFNAFWLGGMYETVVVFETNTTRGQQLAALVKPGFTVVDTRNDAHLEPDTDDFNPDSDRLFARGPAFLLVEAPGGWRFWAGTTHQKSKSGNSVDVTRWRNAEAKVTHAILQELRNTGVEDVVLAGDMNDQVGLQEFEAEAGGDTMTLLVGPEAGGFVLATRDLAGAGKVTYHGMWRDRYRSFIDHVVVSRETADRLGEVKVVDDGWAHAASDHFPVVFTVRPGRAWSDVEAERQATPDADLDLGK